MSDKKINLKNNDEVRPPELQGKRRSSAGSEKSAAHTSGKVSEQSSVKNKTAKGSSKNSHKSETERRLEEQKKAILRQARKRERFLERLNVSVIVAIISFFTLFLVLGERPTKDEDERRELAAMPKFTWSSYFDGSFTNGVSAFFNDAVPCRQSFKNFIALFRASLGVDYDGGVTIVGPLPTIDDTPTNSTPPSSGLPVSSVPSSGGASGSVPSSQTQAQSSSTQQAPPPEAENQGGDMSGSVFVLDDGRGISMFGGNKAGGQEYAETLNRFKSELGESVNVYSMVIPTSGSFYLPKKFQHLMASESDNIDHINSFLNGVTPIDAYSVLGAHANEYIYFRTDHHWQQLGAYYAAEEFAKVAGVPFAPLSEYDKTVREGMLGSLWGYSGNHVNMKKNPDTITFYKPKNDFTVTVYDPNLENPYKLPLVLSDAYYSVNNSYMVYGGDMQVNHVRTDCKNGRKLVIIGDSYDNAMFLNLTNSFEEIWVVDMRANLHYFNYNIIDFIQKAEATDLLFAMDTFSAVGSNRRGLVTMLNEARTVPVDLTGLQ